LLQKNILPFFSSFSTELEEIKIKAPYWAKKKDGLPSHPHALPETRASPQASLFG